MPDGSTRTVAGTSSSGYITKMAFEEGGYFDMVPTLIGGSTSTYYADYTYANSSSSRVLARSGYGTYMLGGVACANTVNGSSSTNTDYGSRLAYHDHDTMHEVTKTEYLELIQG